MTALSDLITRRMPPIPWGQGENLPWDEPAFSTRMLREHLSQKHDLASRRSSRIESHVGWIEQTLLGGTEQSVLDLTCGPGLYLNRLARRGHRGVGIDFSPASIEHARTEATAEGLDVRYVEADIRSADLGTGFDVVMLLYGQLNVFRPPEATSIVRRAFDALAPGGVFVTERFFVVDVADAGVTSHAFTTAAYTDREMVDLLAGAGFDGVRLESSLAGDGTSDGALMVVMGRKPSGSEQP